MARRIISIPPTPEGHPGDCMNRAVVFAYPIPFEETPWRFHHPDTAAEWQQGWDDFAAAHGLVWWRSYEWAPVGLKRWIASVPDITGAGRSHAVAMCFDHLLIDSNQFETDQTAYEEVAISDVGRASALLTPLEAQGRIDCTPLTNPYPHEEKK